MNYVITYIMKSGKNCFALASGYYKKWFGLVTVRERFFLQWDGQRWTDILNCCEVNKDLEHLLNMKRLTCYPEHNPLQFMIGKKVIVVKNESEPIEVGQITGISEYNKNVPLLQNFESRLAISGISVMILPYSDELFNILKDKTWKEQYGFCQQLTKQMRILLYHEE
jgi:hypothetical protein